MPLSPEERKLRARLGVQTRLATEDPVEMTVPPRRAFMQSFIDRARDEAPPGTSEAEVCRRAAALRKAHMTRLGLASATARRKKKERAAPVRTPAPSEVESTPESEGDR